MVIYIYQMNQNEQNDKKANKMGGHNLLIRFQKGKLV